MKPIKNKFVLLFAPNSVKSGRRVLPLSLLAISSYLEKDNYDIRIYHSYDKEEYSEALNYLDKAICVGITSMTGYQILDGLNFAELVRKKNKNIPIVWGGVHPTIKPLQTIKNDLVDIVVVGQGEETFYELVKALEKKSGMENVSGIVYKKNEKIVENPLRAVKDINKLPSIPYHVLGDKIERYIKPNVYAKRNLPIITSDGCSFKCGFCYLAMPEFGKKWQAYPPQRVVDEIEYLVKKYNLSGIVIRDSNFFVDIKRAKMIFQNIIDRNLNISLSGINGRVDQLVKCDDELWRLMEKAGVKELLVGAESGDQEMLDLINKNILVETILDCERKASKYGINIINSFMTGYPPINNSPIKIKAILKRELNRTVELVRKIFKINPVANILLFFYAPYPCTPLYQLCLERGFRNPQTLGEWGIIDLDNQITPWVDKKHKEKTLFLRQLFLLKKITSFQYLKKGGKRGWKYICFKYSGFFWLFNKWIDFRLKYKFYFFPFENFLFSLNKMIK